MLLLVLPIIGVGAWLALRNKLITDNLSAPPTVPFFLLFGAYGALLLFAISEMFERWSAMHSIALFALVFVGIPFFTWQGFQLRRAGMATGAAYTRYHRVAAMLSLGFPLAVAALYGVARLIE